VTGPKEGSTEKPAAPSGQTIQRDVQLSNKYGLHARPATLIAQTAKTFKSEVVLVKGEEKVDAKSIFGLMTLAAEKGATLTIRATGPDAEAAVAKIAALVDAKFNEDD
jgi:phosphotransferase system HPr (HPr) family protein